MEIKMEARQTADGPVQETESFENWGVAEDWLNANATAEYRQDIYNWRDHTGPAGHPETPLVIDNGSMVITWNVYG